MRFELKGCPSSCFLLFPPYVTEQQPIHETDCPSFAKSFVQRGSPSAHWHSTFMSALYREIELLHTAEGDPVEAAYRM